MPRSMNLRSGPYDQPPASSQSSTPQSRRLRLRQALQATNDLAQEPRAGLLTLPMPRPSVSYMAPPSRRRRRSESEEAESGISLPQQDPEQDQARKSKRRRLDQTSARPQPSAIRYGYYGQVEPGRLRLNLVSCDGGEHQDPRDPSISLGAENLLKHNKSVYCSERPYACIILKHADDTPFCLEKLHVVGPEHGFTAPVREGVVYIAMSPIDLKDYIDPPMHARREGIDSPPYRRRTDASAQSSPERLTFAEALGDPEVNNALDNRARRQGQQADGLQNLAGIGRYDGDDFVFGPTDPEAHCELPAMEENLDPASSSSGGAFTGRGITFLSDEEPGPEDVSSQDVLDYRLRRLRSARRQLENSRLDNYERWSGLSNLPPQHELDRETTTQGLSRLGALMARSRVYDSASPEPSTNTTSPYASSKGVEEDCKDKNVTCARFFIRRNTHKVAITFDPPVSGRFILLKVWANRSNVDIQSVIAKGYGGCRFFPATSVR